MEIGTDTRQQPLDLARSRVPVPLARSMDRSERGSRAGTKYNAIGRAARGRGLPSPSAGLSS
jgi:hypothetical protein